MVVSLIRSRYTTHRPAASASAFSASSTDPGLQVKQDGPTSFTIRGVARNGTSVVVLNVSGRTLHLPLRSGMPPEELAATIRRSLHRTHEVKVEGLAYRPGPGQRKPVRVSLSPREAR